jgi:hypothetical protein
MSCLIAIPLMKQQLDVTPRSDCLPAHVSTPHPRRINRTRPTNPILLSPTLPPLRRPIPLPFLTRQCLLVGPRSTHIHLNELNLRLDFL